MDKIYREVPPENIPWNMHTPPIALVDLVESGKIKPCKTVDLGCGTGNYALYLASMGFDVTAIDISPTAIELAEENAKKKGVNCDFFAADLLGDLGQFEQLFELALDWGLLHHIFPKNRTRYVENVHTILKPGGKFLSVCFGEKDPQFGGSGKYRKSPLGTILYFSSEDELKELFSRYFGIEELKTIEISGKFAPHLANYVLMKK